MDIDAGEQNNFQIDNVAANELLNNGSMDYQEGKINSVIENLSMCLDAMKRDILISDAMLKSNFFQKQNAVITTEDVLMELASDGVCDGIFYSIIINVDGHRICRFFEHGNFTGFVKLFKEKIMDELSLDDIIMYQTYNSQDIEYESRRHKTQYSSLRKGDSSSVNYTSFSRKIYTNKGSLNNNLNTIIQQMNSNFCPAVFILCLVTKKDNNWEEYLNSKGHNLNRFYTTTSSEDWESRFTTYFPPTTTSSLSDLQNGKMRLENISEQQKMLMLLPNHHKWPFPEQLEVKYVQRFSNSSRRYPASPRNRVIQAWVQRENPFDILFDVLYNTLFGPKKIRYAIKKIQKRTFSNIEINLEVEANDINNDSSTISQENVLIDNTERYTRRDWVKQLSLYDFYCSQLFRRGTLAWRHLSIDHHEVVMNCYDSSNGNFLEYEYCIVTATKSISSEFNIVCSCQIFSIHLLSNKTKSSCCHSRLLDSILDGKESCKFIDAQKLEHAMNQCSNPVVQLASKSGVDRFSVKSSESSEFVTLFNVAKTKRTVVSCHSSICKIAEGSSRYIKYLEKSEVLCVHLSVFRDFYLNQITLEFNDDLYDNDELDDYDVEIPSTLPNDKWEEVFDEVSGLWKFSPNSPSQKKVDDDPFSAKLKKDLSERSTLLFFTPGLDSENCECGIPWLSDDQPNGKLVKSHKTKLFTDREVVERQVLQRVCLNGCCKQLWDGAENSIFSLSSETAAGYELGWEFVDSVMTSHQTFRGFVTVMNNKYKRFSDSCFMSINTFIDWFFAWASRMNIEFRQGCQMCDGEINILACDGIKLGIQFRNTFVSPIETAANPVPTEFSQHLTRRHDRCFLFNPNCEKETKRLFSQLRAQLRDVSDSITKSNVETLEEYPLLRRNLPSESLPAFQLMFNHQNILIRKAIAGVFKLLSFDCSLDTLFPSKFSFKFQSNGFNDVNSMIEYFQFCSHEMYCSFKSISLDTEALNAFLLLVGYCTKFVVSYLNNTVPPSPEQNIPYSYNPPKFGRAYYFTPSGQQLRSMRRFPIDGDSCNGIFDDAPDTICSKTFPQVGKKGSSYLFLWFCPKHGHCYGFHVIPGSEGRKDPSSSLYTHIGKAPGVILYDFACSLSEFTKNRESGFFKETKFYHDIFHGYTHKCSPAFRCDKLIGFSTVNSSICEQFNSFIQKIKTSSKLMSQSHFTFFLQFFINVWNNQKHLSFRKKQKIALAGTL